MGVGSNEPLGIGTRVQWAEREVRFGIAHADDADPALIPCGALPCSGAISAGTRGLQAKGAVRVAGRITLRPHEDGPAAIAEPPTDGVDAYHVGDDE